MVTSPVDADPLASPVAIAVRVLRQTLATGHEHSRAAALPSIESVLGIYDLPCGELIRDQAISNAQCSRERKKDRRPRLQCGLSDRQEYQVYPIPRFPAWGLGSLKAAVQVLRGVPMSLPTALKRGLRSPASQIPRSRRVN